MSWPWLIPIAVALVLLLIFAQMDSGEMYANNAVEFVEDPLMDGGVNDTATMNAWDYNWGVIANIGAATEPYYEDKAEAYDTSNTGTGNMQ